MGGACRRFWLASCLAVGAILSCVGEEPETDKAPPDGGGGGVDGSVESGQPPDGGSDPGQDGSAPESGSDAGSPYEQAVLADGPVLYLRLGEKKGSMTVTDQKGTSFAVKKGVALGEPGALETDTNTAADFDGLAGYLDLGKSLTLTPGQDFTLEAWIKPHNVTGATRYAVSRYVNAEYEGFLLRLNPDGKITFTAGAADGGPRNVISSAPATANQFVHVVVTLSGTTGTLYLNAVADGTGLFGAIRPGNANTPLGIGGYTAGAVANQFFDGVIDEVAIYDRALDTARVKAHYDAAKK
jgi:large repetitive protein